MGRLTSWPNTSTVFPSLETPVLVDLNGTVRSNLCTDVSHKWPFLVSSFQDSSASPDLKVLPVTQLPLSQSAHTAVPHRLLPSWDSLTFSVSPECANWEAHTPQVTSDGDKARDVTTHSDSTTPQKNTTRSKSKRPSTDVWLWSPSLDLSGKQTFPVLVSLTNLDLLSKPLRSTKRQDTSFPRVSKQLSRPTLDIYLPTFCVQTLASLAYYPTRFKIATYIRRLW